MATSSSLQPTLKDLIFPIELAELYVQKGDMKIVVPNHKCLLNVDRNQPISIVSEQYKLIEHKLAYQYGLNCFKKLFSVGENEIEVYHISTNSKYSVCHIDLRRKGYEITVFENDVYFPFLRITNSYNGTRALQFDLGFIRQWCRNGAIMEAEVVTIKYPHSKHLFKDEPKFEIQNNNWKVIEDRFKNYLHQLKEIVFEQKLLFPIFLQAIEFNIADAESDKKRFNERFSNIQSEAIPLIEKYSKELGSNAYSLFNAVTDYSSNRRYKDSTISLAANTYQRRSGNWVKSLLEEKAGNDFTWEKFLGEYFKFSSN